MLNNTQKRYLKALAHARKAYVTVGGNGLTQAVLEEINLTLEHHELIKIKVHADDRQARDALIEIICTASSSELVQRIGHVAVLFRRNSEAPRIQLP